MTLVLRKQLSNWMSVDCLAVVCLVAMGVAGCGAKPASVNASGEGGAGEAMPVQVQMVESKPIAETTEYLALLKSRHSATINPQVEGYITGIFVKSGDHVAAGTALLQIDPLKQEATVNSQEATRLAQESNLNLARVNLERAKKLAEAGVIAKSDLDNAQTNYDTAVAQLKSLEHQVEQQKVELRYYKVSSPMDGIVGDIPVRVGDRVIVSTLLTTVDEPGALEAYLYIPAARGKDLRLGLPVKLLDEAGSVRTTSQITFVSPQVDQETQTVLAKAAVPNSKANLRAIFCIRGGEECERDDCPATRGEGGRDYRQRLRRARRPEAGRPPDCFRNAVPAGWSAGERTNAIVGAKDRKHAQDRNVIPVRQLNLDQAFTLSEGKAR